MIFLLLDDCGRKWLAWICELDYVEGFYYVWIEWNWYVEGCKISELFYVFHLCMQMLVGDAVNWCEPINVPLWTDLLSLATIHLGWQTRSDPKHQNDLHKDGGDIMLGYFIFHYFYIFMTLELVQLPSAKNLWRNIYFRWNMTNYEETQLLPQKLRTIQNACIFLITIKLMQQMTGFIFCATIRVLILINIRIKI